MSATPPDFHFQLMRGYIFSSPVALPLVARLQSHPLFPCKTGLSTGLSRGACVAGHVAAGYEAACAAKRYHRLCTEPCKSGVFSLRFTHTAADKCVVTSPLSVWCIIGFLCHPVTRYGERRATWPDWPTPLCPPLGQLIHPGEETRGKTRLAGMSYSQIDWECTLIQILTLECDKSMENSVFFGWPRLKIPTRLFFFIDVQLQILVKYCSRSSKNKLKFGTKIPLNASMISLNDSLIKTTPILYPVALFLCMAHCQVLQSVWEWLQHFTLSTVMPPSGNWG